jgi:hypothetical protein
MKYLLPFAFAAISISSCTFNERGDSSKLPTHPDSVQGLPSDVNLEAYTFAFGEAILYMPAGFHRSGSGVRPELAADNIVESFYSSDSSVYIDVSLKGQMSQGEVTAESLEGAKGSFNNVIKNSLNGKALSNEYLDINGQKFLAVEAEIDWIKYRTAADYYATIINGKIFTFTCKYPLADREASKELRRKMIENIVFDPDQACAHPVKFFDMLLTGKSARTSLDSIWTMNSETGTTNLVVVEMNGCTGPTIVHEYVVPEDDLNQAWLYSSGSYSEGTEMSSDTIFEPGTIEIDSVRFFYVPVMSGEWKTYDENGKVVQFWTTPS